MEESKGNSFSATEVGTLLETMDHKIDFIVEIIVPMQKDMGEVKERLTNLETDMRLVKDVIRIEIPSLKKRVTRLEAKS